MKQILLISLLFVSSIGFASVIGISTHPLNPKARVLTAEMTGYMSQRHEVGMGLRYTTELQRSKNLLDFAAAGAQDSRAFTFSTGMDFKVLSEEYYQPRISVKPYLQYLKSEDQKMNVVGVAPTMRKGFSTAGAEFFPFLALPTGIKLDSETDEFVYYSSLTLGMSMPFPTDDKFILSIEGNMDFGASSDYITMMVSWSWK